MKNEDIKISVIIPVYNVEKYLRQCVDSVLNQTYKNIEIILIDDGSTDSCPAICDAYALKDSRVKVVHKKNGGLSSARNAGIRISTGDYLMFVDSDDFWSQQNVLNELKNTMTDSCADVICFGYKEYFEQTQTYRKEMQFPDSLNDLKDNELLQQMLASGIYISSSWCKVVSSKLVNEHNLFFNEGITSEDIDWSARLLVYAKKIVVYPNSFYIYRQREDSIVHTIKYENLEMLADNIKRCIGYVKGISDDNFLRLYYNYVSYQYISFLRVAILCESDKRTKVLFKSMKEYRWLLKYHLNKKVKIIYWFDKLLGYNLMHKALKFYSKVI